jgi:type III pantothenate kinase
MKNLCIDIGNTRTKVGLFHGEKLLETFIIVEEQHRVRIEALTNELDFDRILISSVRNLNQEPYKALLYKKGVIVANHTMKTPLSLKYETPETLGLDRIFAAIGAQQMFPGYSTLSIDAGTCITYDICDANSNYIGGAISPGIKMRLKALNAFTDKLPDLEIIETPVTIGTSTTSSMQMGSKEGAIYEMDGFITHFRRRFGDLKVILTGGDTSFFEQALENAIFAAPNLVLQGMNSVLLFNKPTK